MKKITLSEPPFLSLQGEGQRIGRPTIFVRTYVCNLRCAHCDSKNTWGTGKFGDRQYLYSIESLIDAVEKFKGCKEICLTGGEPMLNGNGEFFKIFQYEMDRAGYELTIETAATIYNTKMIKAPMALWSISPKYPCQMTGYVDWVNHDVLNAMLDKIKSWRMEFKLLISNPRDLSAAKTLINSLKPTVFNKLMKDRVPFIVQPDCEANWTEESYVKGLDEKFKTTAKKIPTTAEYMEVVRQISGSLINDPLMQQFNVTVLPQYHKLLGVV